MVTSPGAIPAITAQLQDPKNSYDSFSAATLLSELLTQYANDIALSTPLAAIVATSTNPAEYEEKSTIANAQKLLGNVLSITLDKIGSDFILGGYLSLAAGGMLLLNDTGETIDSLTARLNQTLKVD